jgi:hypothetical protein
MNKFVYKGREGPKNWHLGGTLSTGTGIAHCITA